MTVTEVTDVLGTGGKQMFPVYLAVMNLIGLGLMGLDKKKARLHAWRIPEKTLFLVSILGGSVGTWVGMYVFRHKTKHWYFVVGMPLILAVQLMICLWRNGTFRYFL